MTDKIETERTKVNLEANRTRVRDTCPAYAFSAQLVQDLLREKNSLIVKRKELRVEIAAMNAAGSFNTLIYG